MNRCAPTFMLKYFRSIALPLRGHICRCVALPRLICLAYGQNIHVFRSLSSTSISCARPGSSKARKKPEPVKLLRKSSKESLEVYADSTLRELAAALNENVDAISDLIVNINESNLKHIENVDVELDRKIVLDVVASYNFKPRFVTRPTIKAAESVIDITPRPFPPRDQLERRAPVVTIMGHVDHGKTTLLDALRNSRIAAQEFGGITQHIGAFSVALPKSKHMVTFIDTPGHSAFRAMRERGARATDIVVLVVAADDGVKDQTVESIRYAKEACVPIVVAMNKCDKPTADPEKARHQLLEHNIVVEDMGGDTQIVEISALTGKNLDKLQEALITQSEIMDLRSTSEGLVEGVVIESTTILGLGKVCTMIVNRGTLRRNSVVLAGTCWGRVRTMHDEFNKVLSAAGPSCPVRISGWRDALPEPGEIVYEVENEKLASDVAELRSRQKSEIKLVGEYKKIDEKRKEEREKYEEIRSRKLEKGWRYSSALRSVFDRENRYTKYEADPNAPPTVGLILRCDVDGTLEAILNVLETYDSDMAKLDIVDFGVGPPTDNIIDLAKEFNALIYCFNVPVPPAVRTLAVQKDVEVKNFNVIYKLVDELKDALSAVLAPTVEEKVLGEGHLLRQFLIPDGFNKKQPIAGTLVDWGTFDKAKSFRFIRNDKVLYDGEVESLKCGNDFVASTGKNTEVGIALPNKDIRFKPDDIVQVYEKVVTTRRIDWNPPGF